MDKSISTKKVLYNISSMRDFALQLLDNGKDYNELLKYLCENDYYNEDSTLPPLKIIQEELGISYSVLKRQLLNIYDDLYKHDESGIEFSIKKTEYWFRMYYFDNYACVILNDLPKIPRIGEHIEIPFFSAKVDTDSFYIHDIQHRLMDNKQIIDITLNPGMYNLYWRIRKDEVFTKGEITWDDYFDHMDYHVKKKLKLPR